MLLNKKETIFINEKQISAFKKQIAELSKQHFEEQTLSQLRKEVEEKKRLRNSVMQNDLEVTSQIHSLNLKKEENKALIIRLSNLEICPTCLQDVNASYRANVLNQLDSTISETNKKLAFFNEEKQNILNKLKAIDY